MITIYQKTVKDARMRTLKQMKVGSWIHVVDPSEEEIDHIVANFDLEEGHVRDALDPFEVPRLEKKDGVIYIFTRIPVESEIPASTTPLLIAVGDTFVSTVSHAELPFLTTFTSKKEISEEIEFSTTQKTKLVLLLLTEINKLYNRSIIHIRRQIRANQVGFEHITNTSVMQLVEIESQLNDFLTALSPIHDNLDTLLSGKTLRLYEHDKDIMEDLYLSNGQLIELCKSKLKTVMNIRDAYSTIMTNNLNRVLRFFAALTIILTIPTIIGSLYGMNVAIPFSDSPHTFPILLILVLVLSAIVYYTFVRKRWI
jgi:magnesium transporter